MKCDKSEDGSLNLWKCYNFWRLLSKPAKTYIAKTYYVVDKGQAKNSSKNPVQDDVYVTSFKKKTRVLLSTLDNKLHDILPSSCFQLAQCRSEGRLPSVDRRSLLSHSSQRRPRFEGSTWKNGQLPVLPRLLPKLKEAMGWCFWVPWIFSWEVEKSTGFHPGVLFIRCTVNKIYPRKRVSE